MKQDRRKHSPSFKARVAREAKPEVRERDLAIVVLFLHTGLRVSELTKLELENC